MRPKAVRFTAAAAKGPDIVDVTEYVRNLEKTHDVQLNFIVRCGSGHYVGCAMVTARISAPVLIGNGNYLVHEISEGFPSHKYTNIEQVMYHLCYRVDYWCSNNVWRQSTLFERAAGE